MQDISSRRHRAVGTAIALSLAFGTGAADAHPIDWGSFHGALPNVSSFRDDCDIVILDHQTNQVDPAQIEIRLEVGPMVSWWKGVGVHASNGKYFEVNTPQGVRSDSMLLDANDVLTAKFIQLGKAKFLGIHTGMYEISDMSALQGGDRVTFRWIQDSCITISGGVINSASKIPKWMPPGTTETVVATIGNVGSPWDPETRITLNVDSRWGSVPAVPLTQYVPPNMTLSFAPNQTVGTATFSFDITAPANPGTYRLRATLNQQGGTGGVVIDRQIEVSATPPPPPANTNPVTPTYVKVPNFIYRNLEDSVKELANLGLPPPIIYGEDPTVPRSSQIITGQYPIGGSSVVDTFHVILDVTPPGFSMFSVLNCDRDHATYYLWGYNNDRWVEIVPIPSLVGDGGLCPAPGTAPVEHTLASGQYNTLVVVDPTRCTQGNDPDYPSCRAYEVVLRGESTGPAYPTVYVE